MFIYNSDRNVYFTLQYYLSVLFSLLVSALHIQNLGPTATHLGQWEFNDSLK